MPLLFLPHNKLYPEVASIPSPPEIPVNPFPIIGDKGKYNIPLPHTTEDLVASSQIRLASHPDPIEHEIMQWVSDEIPLKPSPPLSLPLP